MSRFQSFQGKTFPIGDPQAFARDADLKTLVAWNGPTLGAGTHNVIPKGTRVVALEAKIDLKRKCFVKVAAASGGGPSVWTAASNLEGGLLGETLGLMPALWAVEPDDEHFTVTDPRALVRGPSPEFKATGEVVPQGTRVVITERSAGRAYVRIARNDGTAVGWTASSNLSSGWCDAFADTAWSDSKGPNACWEGGKFLGSRPLVLIVGFGGEVECITADALLPWRSLEAAARTAGFVLAIESGFRTWREQERLYAGYKANLQGFNKAAPPGSSNHQNGVALDLNTGGFQTPIYGWLAANATKHGFIRTVSGEHWHWEYHPEEAGALRQQGRFTRSGVAP